ncbi:MAG: PhzF family phenazine biosynthesis protein [Balneolaceae bacterium]
MNTSKIETFIVDSFTDQAFKGNPAGVCISETALDIRLMTSIAKELNLSETAFISKSDELACYSIRYFSPKMEIPLCGHATLAASKILFDKTGLKEIAFTTIQDINLIIKSFGNHILMEFPIYMTVPSFAPPPLLDALGIKESINSEYNEETNILLIEIESANELSSLSPDFEALYKSHDSINGVLVTAKSNDSVYDFHSRYFWPWSGTNEDPVTGGTHTFLSKYWAKRLNKTKMNSFQSSKRTGSMEVELVTDSKLIIKGQAVIVFEGHLIL